MTLHYIVNNENISLKTLLKEKLYISTRLLSRLKNGRCILVNSLAQDINFELHKGDKIDVILDNISKNNDYVPIDEYDYDLDVLYEDEYILVINKPYGIEVHPSMNNFNKTIANAVIHYYKVHNINQNKVHLITRLDKNTSGVCMIAKNEYIQELFLRKKDVIHFKKYYIAIANGIINADYGIIEKPIARKEDSIIFREVSTTGDYAKTEYYVIERNVQKNFTAVKVLLCTGRTHQIRVHFNYLGHTLLGDDLYATTTEKEYICKYISRQALHAYNISFTHPITERSVNVTASIPDDLFKLFKSHIF